MSVVAWDGTVLAADRMRVSGDISHEGGKSRQMEGGTILAWVGELSKGLAAAKWYERGANPDFYPESQKDGEEATLIVVTADAVVVYESTPEPIVILAEYMAWGSGSHLAIGAMSMGSGAIAAVRVAMRHSPYCGYGVDHYRRVKESKPEGVFLGILDRQEALRTRVQPEDATDA